MTTLVFDGGALIALERRDPRMVAATEVLVNARMVAHTSAAVLAQVWRGSPRQHAVITLVRSGAIRVHGLSEEVGLRLGLLLASSRTSDVVDAHVVLLAKQLSGTVLTSDPNDLRRIDESLPLIVV